MNLAIWLFWALVNLLWLAAAIKRAAERVTLHVIRRRKARLMALRAAPFAPAPAPV
jgi:hypothetical protein